MSDFVHPVLPARYALPLAGRNEACPSRNTKVLIRLRMLGVVIALLGMSACSTYLEPMRQQHAGTVLNMYRARPAAVAANGKTDLTVDDCKNLVLHNNLDYQVAVWEEMTKKDTAKGSLVRMLPRSEFLFEQTQRDRLPFTRSDVLGSEGAYEVVGPGPGTGVTNFSNGRERGMRRWQAELKWSPMDAAMARYLAAVKRNEAVQSSYQRVRVAQQLVGTVTGAFYRLLALEMAMPQAISLERNRQEVVRDLKSLSDKQMVEPKEYIEARANLAVAKEQVIQLSTDIGKQRELLAAGMNICPDSYFRVVGALFPLPESVPDPCKLEATALINRPEAYQADLTYLNSLADHKRLIVKLFPRAEGFIGHYRDENKFQLERDWTDGGFRVTWELMEFTATLLDRKAADEHVQKTDHERALVSIGILSSVRMKGLEAVRALERCKKGRELELEAAELHRIAGNVEQAKEKRAPERITLISKQKAYCNLLQAKIETLLSAGEVHAAFATLDATVGTNYGIGAAKVNNQAEGPVERLLTKPVELVERALSSIRLVGRKPK
ncbi:MAG: hypothetical protein V2B18_09865 [Pseudomonadota bacterium]